MWRDPCKFHLEVTKKALTKQDEKAVYMGVSQLEREALAGWPMVERRKGERRKDVETARNWKGLERRIAERRHSEDEHPTKNETP